MQPKRRLGRSPLEIPPFALGGNVFGWTADESASWKVLDAFVDAGFSLIDTADSYSAWAPGHAGGESEGTIGRWLKASGRREEVVLATKVGMAMGDGSKGLTAEHIERSAGRSLERLGTERIDLYFAHIDDPTTPLVETLHALDRLVQAGSVGTLGASNYSADRLAEALRVSREEGLARFECLQPRYNLLDRADFETEIAGLCEREQLGVVTYSSLASGFLTGKYRSTADLAKSPRGARMAPRLGARGIRVLAALDDVALRLGTAPASVALAWVMQRPVVTAPIASATSVAQLTELLAAAELRLDRAAVEQLDRASEPLPG